jgi:hypothetical protein
MRKNLYCGVDLHSNNALYVITDEQDQQLLHKRLPTELPAVLEALAPFQKRLKVVAVDASERFLSRLKGVANPEEKRRIIGHEFIEVFKQKARELKAAGRDVIGLGMGEGHIEGYQSHPKAKVVAIADVDPHRLREAGDKFKINVRYDSAEAMLARERLDVVSVCTPNKFHKPLTVAALDAGCHVLCEKPMAMNSAEAREMIAAAKRNGKRLMFNFSYRFTEQSWALKKASCTDCVKKTLKNSSSWPMKEQSAPT